MSKFLVILRREYAQIVKKKSFIIMTLATPVIMTAFMVLPSLLIRQGVQETETYAVIDRSGEEVGPQVAEAMGTYTLDDSTAAYELEKMAVLRADDESEYEREYDSLVQMIRDRTLDYLLIIRPGATVADSNLMLVTNSDNFRTLRRFEYQLSQVLSEQRLEASQVNLPIDSVMQLTRSISLPRQDTQGVSIRSEVKLFTGMVLVLLIYMLILIDGSALMRSIVEEKSTRIMEVLISSVTPFQLMAGKIVGTGLAALTQVGIWIAAAVAVMLFTGSAGTGMEEGISRVVFNPATLTCFGVYLVIGYLMYSTLFALIGSLVNSEKEAQPLIMPIIFILFMPSLIVGPVALENPDAGWFQVMSFIPFYTPLLMVMRVSMLAPTIESNLFVSDIMIQAYIGMIGVLLMMIVLTWISARVFRVGILMYGKRPTLPEVLKWIRHS